MARRTPRTKKRIRGRGRRKTREREKKKRKKKENDQRTPARWRAKRLQLLFLSVHCHWHTVSHSEGWKCSFENTCNTKVREERRDWMKRRRVREGNSSHKWPKTDLAEYNRVSYHFCTRASYFTVIRLSLPLSLSLLATRWLATIELASLDTMALRMTQSTSHDTVGKWGRSKESWMRDCITSYFPLPLLCILHVVRICTCSLFARSNVHSTLNFLTCLVTKSLTKYMACDFAFLHLTLLFSPLPPRTLSVSSFCCICHMTHERDERTNWTEAGDCWSAHCWHKWCHLSLLSGHWNSQADETGKYLLI